MNSAPFCMKMPIFGNDVGNVSGLFKDSTESTRVSRVCKDNFWKNSTEYIIIVCGGDKDGNFAAERCSHPLRGMKNGAEKQCALCIMPQAQNNAKTVADTVQTEKTMVY